MNAVNETKVAEFKAEAAAHYAAKEESFQSCDTDGFVSQWAHGIMGNVAALNAQIAADGGVYPFPVLVNLDGQPVAAELKYLKSKFKPSFAAAEPVWMVHLKTGGVKWVKAFPVKPGTLNKKGFAEATMKLPAEAYVAGEGYGLSGKAWAAAKQLVPYPAGAVKA
jgi:hypothetical protein